MSSEAEKILKLIGNRLVGSVKRNFREGGRPVKWESSKRASETTTNKRGKTRTGKTLVDKGILQNSINYKIEGDTLKVGTNVIYSAIHNFGYKGEMSIKTHQRTITKAWGKKIKPTTATIKAHQRSITMPARPFMLIQDEDREYISNIAKDYVVKILSEETQ